MIETIEIGATPYEEDCYQVGCDNYVTLAKIQCNAFIAQLVRALGSPPPGAKLFVKGNPHDFGRYYEVAVSFDSNNESAAEYAYNLDANVPASWDSEAKIVPNAVSDSKP